MRPGASPRRELAPGFQFLAGEFFREGLLRRVITAVLRFALRVFFRRIEVVGAERVPPRGGCLFVLNHPNGLVDPVFLLCFAPRPPREPASPPRGPPRPCAAPAPPPSAPKALRTASLTCSP